MPEKVVSFIPPAGKSDLDASVRRFPLKNVVLLMLPLFLAQIGLYYRSFGVKPASDDYPIVHEIVRGNLFGPGVFFRESMSNMHHRPFKSLSMWWFGQLSDAHRAFWIRVLHFIAMGAYALVLALLLSRLDLSPLACAIASLVMLFHPTLPQALSSVDGMDGIFSDALIWLGAWLTLVGRNHVWRALAANVVCFILAAGWKEYSFALVPLATWTILCFGEKHRLRNAAILFVGLCVVFVAILFVRQRAIPPGYNAGLNYASLNPIQWIQNAAIMGSGLLFFGNSIWVFVHQSGWVIALVGFCILVALGVIVAGVIREFDSRRRWIIFLLGSFVAASFPVNVIFHMSEMYLSPLLLPLALICGIATDGWRSYRQSARRVACVFAIAALISSAITVIVKVEGLRDVGQRAENQMMQLLSLLPMNPHDLKIAILFDLNDLPPRRTYSVYRMGDEVLVVHSMALDYYVPGRNLVLGSFPLGSPDFHREQFDLVFNWNYAKQRFERANF